MNRAEWNQMAADMMARWGKGPISTETLDAWYNDLQHHPAAHVDASIQAIYRAGSEWYPHAGQVSKKIDELTVSPPTWLDVKRIVNTLASYPDNAIRGGEIVDIRAKRLEEEHPAVQEFIRRVGWQELAHRDLSDTTAEAQLRNKYESHIRERMEDMQLYQLDADLPRIQQARKTVKSPHQLDPLKSLGGEAA